MAQGKILVVDDQESIRKLVSMHLRKRGYDVLGARDGCEGLEKALKHHPDIIISDLMMPGMDGIEFCKRIKADKDMREVFFIMLTAKGKIEDKVEGFGSGADDYMVKPFNHHELLARVESAMRICSLQGELRELNNLKDEFLGMVAHDLRNPLTVIKGWCDLFAEDLLGDLTSEQVEAIDGISQQSILMLDLINDLLDVTKIESGKVELSLSQYKIQNLVAGQLRAQTLVASKKHITLVNRVPDDLPPVWLDPDRMTQALNNLLSNAFKFSPEHATVTISAARNGNFVEVSVSDTGVGIPPEDLDRLFQKFVQVGSRPTRGEKGIGLGLAIVKKIVELHGGRVWATSKVGEGSTFTFSLPVEKRSSAEPEPSAKETSLEVTIPSEN